MKRKELDLFLGLTSLIAMFLPAYSVMSLLNDKRYLDFGLAIMLSIYLLLLARHFIIKAFAVVKTN